MALADLCVILEVTEGLLKPLNFDMALTIYTYIEPTISSTIILMCFIKDHQRLYRSFDTLNQACNQMKILKMEVSFSYPRLFLYTFFLILSVGSVAWTIITYFQRTIVEMIYEALSYGVGFSIQGVIVTFLVLHTSITLSVLAALNARLKGLTRSKLHANQNQLLETLRLTGQTYHYICKAYEDIFKVCFPTLFLFSLRAYFQFCVALMILSGIFPKMDINIWFPLALYGFASFLVAFMNDGLNKSVSVFS